VQGTRVLYSLPQRTDVKPKQSKFDRVYTRSRCTGSISTALHCTRLRPAHLPTRLHRWCTPASHPRCLPRLHRWCSHAGAIEIRDHVRQSDGQIAVQSCCRSWVETTRARASSAPCPVRAHLALGHLPGQEIACAIKCIARPYIPAVPLSRYQAASNFASIIGVLFI
jgi:hypothetical protein